MSLFLRRQLQRCIIELDGYLPSAAIKGIVKRLNGGGTNPLDAEWEVVLLWSLSRSYQIEYEPGHPNAPKLDLVVRNNGDSSQLFAADIRCVNDTGYHGSNPVERLSNLIGFLKFDAGLKGNVHWNVTGEMKGDYGRAKLRLNLPENAKWDLLESQIKVFLL